MMDRRAGSDATVGDRPDAEAWIEALLHVARHYGLGGSAEQVRVSGKWLQREQGLEQGVAGLAGQLGLELRHRPWPVDAVTLPDVDLLPLIVEFRDGALGIAEGMRPDGNALEVTRPDHDGLVQPLELADLKRRVHRLWLARPARNRADARIDAYVQPWRPDWLRRIILRDWRPFGHIMLASLLANTLSLAGLVFAMQVYDRVVPAESMPTLYVLFTGVALALLFEFSMRVARVRLIDATGQAADLRISDRVFGHALRIRNSHRPRATGTFISQLRELERIRDFMTSSTVSVLADLPFFLLFLLVFWYVAGALVLVPLAALVLMVLPGLLAQPRLRRLATEAMREASLRNALLVETVQGLDDIKLLQAEPRIQSQWNRYNQVTGDVNLRLRGLTQALTSWGQTVQTGAFAVVVLFGAPMVMAGDLTTGALVAASILAARMLVPMAQISQVLGRWQHARVALEGLNQLLQRPLDQAPGERRLQRHALHGDYHVERAIFRYEPEQPAVALSLEKLQITAGERIAVLGRNGAGKSTLLQALSGLLAASEGQVLLDGLPLERLDPADLRRDLGFLSQQARLFHGSVRDNLVLGAPQVDDEHLLEMLQQLAGPEALRRLPDGLDQEVQEGGLGLSGGQQRILLLARTLLRRPRILLLDEPTTALDDVSEQRVIQVLRAHADDSTLIMATHRRNLLPLVDRVLVVDGGRIVLDGPRDVILRRLSGSDGTAQGAAPLRRRARS